ncbi:transglutaminase-like domain-containing protein [Rossellomorea marisflavi]|uniref:transglutaminase-like domain-containing protein n=1 Tax=Rossellomorea marisflavi TaxID=189381 RepID=UPI00296E280D|nr:transglutaminase-like domain-containing protein [Rossellomorea marisflavi]MDW4528366.1 transglutaminase-like domain-containing protein [Rossellomorea marisflavi]
MKTFKVSYSYKNSVCPSLSLWMVIPSGVKAIGAQPEQVTLLPTGEELGYFVLEEGIELEVTFEQGEYTPDQQVLSDVERLFYLRDTTLSSIDEVKEKTLEMTGHVTDPKEKARVIFMHIVKEYRYIYPPAERGVASFLQTGKGDCGEFSFLFTAMCRAAGIPARTIVGSWANGKMNAHVWNECYIDGEGWFPVDTSMANVQKRQPLRFFGSDVPTLYWEHYFGRTEGRRIVFAKDAELPLMPHYKDEEDPVLFNVLPINGQSFCWGQQSLDGAAPYLQPVYIKFEESVPYRDLGVTELMGTWKVKGPPWLEGTVYLKRASFFMGLVGVLLSWITGEAIFDLFYTGSFMVYALISLVRKERMMAFGVVFILMTLSFVAAWGKAGLV